MAKCLVVKSTAENIPFHFHSLHSVPHCSWLLPRHLQRACRCFFALKSPLLHSGRLIISKRKRCGYMSGAQMADLTGGFGDCCVLWRAEPAMSAVSRVGARGAWRCLVPRGCHHPAPHLAVRACGSNPCVLAYLQHQKEGYAKGYGEFWPRSRGTSAIFAHDGMRVSRPAITLAGVLYTSSPP